MKKVTISEFKTMVIEATHGKQEPIDPKIKKCAEFLDSNSFGYHHNKLRKLVSILIDAPLPSLKDDWKFRAIVPGARDNGSVRSEIPEGYAGICFGSPNSDNDIYFITPTGQHSETYHNIREMKKASIEEINNTFNVFEDLVARGLIGKMKQFEIELTLDDSADTTESESTAKAA